MDFKLKLINKFDGFLLNELYRLYRSVMRTKLLNKFEKRVADELEDIFKFNEKSIFIEESSDKEWTIKMK